MHYLGGHKVDPFIKSLEVAEGGLDTNTITSASNRLQHSQPTLKKSMQPVLKIYQVSKFYMFLVQFTKLFYM